MRTKQTCFDSYIYILITNQDISSDHLWIYDFAQTNSKISAVENGEEPKLAFSLTQLLIVIDFHYLPLKICFLNDKFLYTSYK